MRRACMRVLEKQVLCCASPPANAHAFGIYMRMCMHEELLLCPVIVSTGRFCHQLFHKAEFIRGKFPLWAIHFFQGWYWSERYLFLSSSLPMISLNKSNLLFVIIVLPSCPVVFFLLQKRITHKNSSSLNESTLFPSLWQALSQSKR